jgi:hypothetical protein
MENAGECMVAMPLAGRVLAVTLYGMGVRLVTTFVTL